MKKRVEKKKLRVLSANKYDALEFAAEVYGGVGSGAFFDMSRYPNRYPLCGYGLAAEAGIIAVPYVGNYNSLWDAHDKNALPFGVYDSDAAVGVARRGRPGSANYHRVPFKAWAEALGLVRGK